MQKERKKLKIVLVAPKAGWDKLFQEVLSVYKRFNPKSYENCEFTLETVLRPDYVNFQNLQIPWDADVLIARGVGSIMLRKMVEIPVVQIHLGYRSLEQDAKCAIKQFHSKKIALVGHNFVMFNLSDLQEINGVKLCVYNVAVPNSNKEIKPAIEAAMEKAAADGCDTFICGNYGYVYGQKRGWNVLFQDIGFEEAWHAVLEAQHSAQVYSTQRIKTELYRNIMNYSFEGLISLDEEVHFRAYNDAAVRLLAGETIPAEKIESEMLKMLEKSGILEYLKSRKSCMGKLVSCGNRFLTANIIPTKREGKFDGSMIMLQDVTYIQQLEKEIRKQIHARGHVTKYSFQHIVGRSPSIADAVSRAQEYAKTQANILIYGATGTGKEIFAQSIHSASPRKNGPFVAVNCAALTESLLEAELFGYVGGAFTGAAKGGKAGFFEMAHRGTIFLDEISEIPMRVQGKLLRVLQEREIVRVGDDKITPVDVRIICATNRNLRELIEEGSFREDLYYRLDVLHLSLPSLDERKQDIPLLARKFFMEYMEKNHLALKIENSVYEALAAARWKGNVRELKNVCERLCVVALNGEITGELLKRMGIHGQSKIPVLPAETAKQYHYMEEAERGYILEELRRAGGRKDETARNMGVSRATLYRKLKKYGIR